MTRLPRASRDCLQDMHIHSSHGGELLAIRRSLDSRYLLSLAFWVSFIVFVALHIHLGQRFDLLSWSGKAAIAVIFRLPSADYSASSSFWRTEHAWGWLLPMIPRIASLNLKKPKSKRHARSSPNLLSR